jgi:hypothetical protein
MYIHMYVFMYVCMYVCVFNALIVGQKLPVKRVPGTFFVIYLSIDEERLCANFASSTCDRIDVDRYVWYVCTYMHVCRYIHAYVHTYIYTYVYIRNTYIHVCISYTRIYMYIHTCVCVCMCVCLCVLCVYRGSSRWIQLEMPTLSQRG